MLSVIATRSRALLDQVCGWMIEGQRGSAARLRSGVKAIGDDMPSRGPLDADTLLSSDVAAVILRPQRTWQLRV